MRHATRWLLTLKNGSLKIHSVKLTLIYIYILLLGFAHVSIITAVVTGSFAGATLSFKFHFTLILC